MNCSTSRFLLVIVALLGVCPGCQDGEQPTPRIVEGERTDAMGLPLEMTISDIPPVPADIMGAAQPAPKRAKTSGPAPPNGGIPPAGPAYGLPLEIATPELPGLADVPPEIRGPSVTDEEPGAWRRVWHR